jgi:hypothetical protein
LKPSPWSLAAAFAAAGITLSPTPASAQAVAPDVADVPPTSPIDHREEMTRLELGYRGSFVPDPGFDPFSNNDFLPAFSMAVTRTVFAAGRLSFAAGVAWDNEGSTATIRGIDGGSLRMNRITVPLEGRLHFGPWGYAFARAAPGVAALETQVSDASAPATLSKTQWLFATDLSAGVAWLVWPRFERYRMTARYWLQADGGYGFVAQGRLNLGPDLPSGSTQRVDGVDLGTISMNGGFFRLAAAISF